MPVKKPKKGKVKQSYPNPIPDKVKVSESELTAMQEIATAEILREVFANNASYATVEKVFGDIKLLKKFNKIFSKGGKPVFFYDKKNLEYESKNIPSTKRSKEYGWIESFYAQQKVLISKFDKNEWTEYNREKGFMDYITKIVTTEFKESVSQKDAWNPADIWLVRNEKNIRKKIDIIVKKPRNETSIDELNEYLTTLYLNARKSGTSGDALTGLSLKKISGKSALYEEVNLNEKYFENIVKKSGGFLYSYSKLRINLQIESISKDWKFETQDTQLTVKNNKNVDVYAFQIKGNTTSGLCNLKFEPSELAASAARMGKCPLDLMVVVAKNHKHTEMYDSNTRKWQNYPQTYKQWSDERDGLGYTYHDYKNMFTIIKSKPNVDVGGVKNEDEFEENFDKVFQTKNKKLQSMANVKLQQLCWVYKLLNNFSSAKNRDKYLTDMVYISQKKGNSIFPFGPFGKIY
jgi:hypothetical protein|tara:strand:- start:42 stop:1427 length:1386 start_codon:yes stop_codon:yes gene_type:complete